VRQYLPYTYVWSANIDKINEKIETACNTVTKSKQMFRCTVISPPHLRR